MQLFATVDEVIADLEKGRQQAVLFMGEKRFYYSPSQFEVDTIDVLKELKAFEVPFKFPEISEKELYTIYEDDAYWYLQQCMNQTWGICEEFVADNTYNWNAKVSNHLQYHLYENPSGRTIAAVEINLHGDVRANYSPWMIFSCYSKEEFIEALCTASRCVQFATEKWIANITINACSEMMIVEAFTTGNDEDAMFVQFETCETEPEYLEKKIMKELGL